jgi:hypothetical protein
MKLGAGVEQSRIARERSTRYPLPRLLSRRCTENRAAAFFLQEKLTNTPCVMAYMNSLSRRVRFMVRAVLYHAVVFELLRDVKKWSFPAAGQLSHARRLNPTE